MKKLARNMVLAGCFGSSLTAAPFLAIGDNAELFAVADASVSYNDNVNLDSSGAENEDVIATFRPGFELQFGKDSLVTGSVDLNYTLTSYSDDDSLNNQLLGVGGRVSYSSGALVSFSADASYTELDQAVRDNSTVVTDIRSTVVERDVTSAGVSGELAYSEKFSFGSGARYGHVNYRQEDYIEQQEYSIPVNVYYELTPKVDLSVGVSYKYTELDNVEDDAADEYNDIYYNVGARGDFTPKLGGSFSVGYTTRDGNGDDDDDEGTLGATSALNYAYSEKTQLTLSLNRSFGNSGSSGDSFENTSIGIRATSAITADWSINTGVAWRRYDYEAYTNDYYEYSLGAGYIINEHLSGGLNYTFRKQLRDSTEGSKFDNNLVTISVSARY